MKKIPTYLLFLALSLALVITFAGCSSFEDGFNDAMDDAQSEQNNASSKTENVTTGEKMALNSAKNYLRTMGFSKQGLMEQLKFEGYTTEEATYAVNNCGANWQEQAVRVAKSYLDTMPFSKQALIEQLEFDGFTSEEAAYGVEQAYK